MIHYSHIIILLSYYYISIYTSSPACPPLNVNTDLPPALRVGGVVYWCPGRSPASAAPFPASGLFSLSRAAPPSSPAPPPSLPSSKACRLRLFARHGSTFLCLPRPALLRHCRPSGCVETGRCLTAEEGGSGWNGFGVLFFLLCK